MPLPVMVTEALTFGSGDVSVGMSPSGWCWVVTGRRVLAWPQELTGSSGPGAVFDFLSEGRPTVSCTTLRPPSGWLGGIGQRVSLLFFGSMPAHADTKLVGVVILSNLPPTTYEEESDELICMVAGGPLLQMWCGSALHEHHLRRPLLDAAARTHLAPHAKITQVK